MNKMDIGITADGDLFLAQEAEDLAVVTDDAYKVQMAFCRIKSIKHDWYLDHIGADLEAIIGQANSKETRLLGIDKIIQAVTFDSLYTVDDIYIEAKALDNHIIGYDVYLKNLDGKSSTLLKVQLDLIKGVMVGGIS